MFDLTKKAGLQSSLENIKEGVRSTKTVLVEHTTSVPQFGTRLAEKMMDTVSSITKRATDNITTQDDQAQAALQVIEAAKAAGAKSVKVKMSKDASVGFATNIGSKNIRFGVVNDGVVELEVTF